MRAFIIAEAGVNHNGSIDTAKKLVDAAADAGADAVKFQAFTARNTVIASAPTAAYQAKGTGRDETQFEMLKRLELSPEMFGELMAHCGKRGIVFMSTPFDEESADMLDALGMGVFKISSGEITNRPLLRHVASKGKDIFLSTGMSYLEEVEKAVGWIYEAWDALESRPRLTLLHCVSNYPASFSDVNLSAMKTLATAFGVPVGYSDHTLGIEAPIAAVAMGASVIEKHFTLDRDMEGPDHKASLDPVELNAMVGAIRNIEEAIGDGTKRPARGEEDIRALVRRSLVAARDMKVGHIMTASDIAVKRPGGGIAPEFLDAVVGMRLGREVLADSILEWKDLRNA